MVGDSLSCYFSDAGFDCTFGWSVKKSNWCCKNIFKKNKLKAKFKVDDTNALGFDDNSFDIIFSIGLLEHFEDIRKPLKEQIRVLDKGGIWFGYIVPEFKYNVQKNYNWINKILKGYNQKVNQTKNRKQKYIDLMLVQKIY